MSEASKNHRAERIASVIVHVATIDQHRPLDAWITCVRTITCVCVDVWQIYFVIVCAREITIQFKLQMYQLDLCQLERNCAISTRSVSRIILCVVRTTGCTLIA